MGNPRGLPGVRAEDPRGMVRKPAVAGSFYPGSAAALREEVESLLQEAKTPPLPGVRGALSPHAGYRYAGKAMAESFRALSAWRGRARRVFLLGPRPVAGCLGPLSPTWPGPGTGGPSSSPTPPAPRRGAIGRGWWATPL
ncbi:hypothetical protein Thermus77420_20450 [Thermus thalpophilus]